MASEALAQVVRGLTPDASPGALEEAFGALARLRRQASFGEALHEMRGATADEIVAAVEAAEAHLWANGPDTVASAPGAYGPAVEAWLHALDASAHRVDPVVAATLRQLAAAVDEDLAETVEAYADLAAEYEEVGDVALMPEARARWRAAADEARMAARAATAMLTRLRERLLAIPVGDVRPLLLVVARTALDAEAETLADVEQALAQAPDDGTQQQRAALVGERVRLAMWTRRELRLLLQDALRRHGEAEPRGAQDWQAVADPPVATREQLSAAARRAGVPAPPETDAPLVWFAGLPPRTRERVRAALWIGETRPRPVSAVRERHAVWRHSPVARQTSVSSTAVPLSAGIPPAVAIAARGTALPSLATRPDLLRTAMSSVPALAAHGVLTPEAWRLAMVRTFGPAFAVAVRRWQLNGFHDTAPDPHVAWSGWHEEATGEIGVTQPVGYWLRRFAEGDRTAEAWRAVALLLHEHMHAVGARPPKLDRGHRENETLEEALVEVLAQRTYQRFRTEDDTLSRATEDDVTRHTGRPAEVHVGRVLQILGGDDGLARIWHSRSTADRIRAADDLLLAADPTTEARRRAARRSVVESLARSGPAALAHDTDRVPFHHRIHLADPRFPAPPEARLHPDGLPMTHAPRAATPPSRSSTTRRAPVRR